MLNNLLHPFQITSISQTALTVLVLAFAALCIYKLITDSSFVGKLIGVCLLVVAVSLLAGCSGNDGFTTRTQINADARVDVARARRDAEIGVAQAKASAEIQSNFAWATAVPVTIAIVFGSFLALFVLACISIHADQRHERMMLMLRQGQRIGVDNVLEIPEQVRKAAILRGGVAQWDEYSQRWLILHPMTRQVIAKQRLIEQHN